MAPSPCPVPRNELPPDLTRAVAQDAVAAAEHVARFLDVLGLRPTEEGGVRVPVRLPAFFLLGLGAALRLRAWEQAGLHAHRDAGLPSARAALGEVFQALTAPGPLAAKEEAARQLAGRVLDVFLRRLAWGGRALLDADLELGEADEDALVEALATFLWAHRHDGAAAPTEGGRP
jgi:hypothetical protein